MSNTNKNVLIVESFNKTTFKEVKTANVPEGMMMVEGILGVVDVVNRNNRIYSREEYVTHVNQLNQRIQESNGVLGELEHPKSMTINLNNISHKVMEVKVLENDNVWGKVLLLDTPKGQIAQSVVRSGSPLPISSRAQGQVMENGSVKLQHLATYDLVGTAGFAQAALGESVVENGQVIFESYMFDLNENGQIVENAKDDSIVSNLSEEQIQLAVEKYLSEHQEKLISVGQAIVNENATEEQILLKVEEAVDQIMIEKYLPLVESWVTEEVAPTIAESTQQWVTNEFAPVVESWVTNEAVPQMLSEHATTTMKIVKEDNEEVKPGSEEPINQSFTKDLNSTSEIFKSELLAKIDSHIEKAELAHDEPGKKTAEPVFVDESQFMMTPVWLNKCPQEYKHIWSQLNESQKSEIYRRASVRIFSTNEDVSTFWNSLNFNQIIESQNVFRRNKPTTLVIENAEDNPRRSIIAFSKNLKSNK